MYCICNPYGSIGVSPLSNFYPWKINQTYDVKIINDTNYLMEVTLRGNSNECTTVHFTLHYAITDVCGSGNWRSGEIAELNFPSNSTNRIVLIELPAINKIAQITVPVSITPVTFYVSRVPFFQGPGLPPVMPYPT
jgi:hypothetical protein